ncbi:hypothetical protein B0H21DRAFT_671456, partial [Amylocystis lapponica]
QGDSRIVRLRVQINLHASLTMNWYSYGRKGYHIIFFMMLHLFPDLSFDLAPWKPLHYQAVLTEVLVPETTVHLIQEDLLQGWDDAMQTLRESCKYGNFLYPGDE